MENLKLPRVIQEIVNKIDLYFIPQAHTFALKVIKFDENYSYWYNSTDLILQNNDQPFKVTQQEFLYMKEILLYYFIRYVMQESYSDFKSFNIELPINMFRPNQYETDDEYQERYMQYSYKPYIEIPVNMSLPTVDEFLEDGQKVVECILPHITKLLIF